MAQLNYQDIINYLKSVDSETICEDTHGDGLEELMLNTMVSVLAKHFDGMPKDSLVDISYEVIHELKHKFSFYVSCAVADGFMAAMELDDPCISIQEQIQLNLTKVNN